MIAPDAAHRRRLFLPWRIAFVLYAVALTIGLHWPHLALGTAEHPAPGKVIHALSFAGLTVLLWFAGWIRRGAGRLWGLWGVLSIWAVVNELAQGVITTGRTVSPLDAVANVLGVTSASIWICALAPVGSEANRIRLARQRYVFFRVIASPLSWVVGVAAAAPLVWGLIWGWPVVMSAYERGMPLLMICVGVTLWWAGCSAFLLHRWRVEYREVMRERLCFSCGRPVPGSWHGDASHSNTQRCPTCSKVLDMKQWTAAPHLPALSIAQAAGASAIAGLAAFIAILASTALAAYLFDSFATTREGINIVVPFTARQPNIPADFHFVVDAAAVSIVLAVITRRFRTSSSLMRDRLDR